MLVFDFPQPQGHVLFCPTKTQMYLIYHHRKRKPPMVTFEKLETANVKEKKNYLYLIIEIAVY